MRSVRHERKHVCANFANKNANKAICSANILQTMANAFKLWFFSALLVGLAARSDFFSLSFFLGR